MQLVKELEGKSRSIVSGRLVLLLIVMFFMAFMVQAEEPVNSFSEVQNDLKNLELKLEKAILEIDNTEKKLIQNKVETCEKIERQLKAADDKKIRLSKKKRKELEKKLLTEYKTINMVKQLNMLSRDAKKKEYETEVEEIFAKHDSYLSVQ